MLKNKDSITAGANLDQIIPINGMLKNLVDGYKKPCADQIIPINGMLKNKLNVLPVSKSDQIIPINGMLKNVHRYQFV